VGPVGDAADLCGQPEQRLSIRQRVHSTALSIVAGDTGVALP
jgi:hypothetical protein